MLSPPYPTSTSTGVATMLASAHHTTLVHMFAMRVGTTNGVERLNEEIRRRERVIRIFPNRESVLRLVGALLMEQDEVWTTGKRYFDMTAYWQWREHQSTQSTRFQEAQEASMLQPA